MTFEIGDVVNWGLGEHYIFVSYFYCDKYVTFRSKEGHSGYGPKEGCRLTDPLLASLLIAQGYFKGYQR